jgi:hypothetical protein
MPYYTSSNHIRVDINHASSQMITVFYSGGMIAVFPVSALSFLPLIKLLPGSSSNQLH